MIKEFALTKLNVLLSTFECFKYKVKVVHVQLASSGAAKTCTNMKTYFWFIVDNQTSVKWKKRRTTP